MNLDRYVKIPLHFASISSIAIDCIMSNMAYAIFQCQVLINENCMMQTCPLDRALNAAPSKSLVTSIITLEELTSFRVELDITVSRMFLKDRMYLLIVTKGPIIIRQVDNIVPISHIKQLPEPR